jgi:hypothetical protein
MNVRRGGPTDGTAEPLAADGRHQRPSEEAEAEEKAGCEVDADEPPHVRLIARRGVFPPGVGQRAGMMLL